VSSLSETKPTPKRPKKLFGQTLGVWLLAEFVEDTHQPNDVLVPGVFSNPLDVCHETKAPNAFEAFKLWLCSVVKRPHHTGEDNLTRECRVNEAKVLGHQSSLLNARLRIVRMRERAMEEEWG